MEMLHSGRRGALALTFGAILALSLAAPAVAANPVRPFLGHTGGTGTIAPATDACPFGSMFLVGEHDTGNMAHLGRVDVTMSHCAVFNFGTGVGSTTGYGSVTIIAANGDQLLLSYTGMFTASLSSTPPTAVGAFDWFVTGGTGQFAAATGSGEDDLTITYTPDLTGAATSSLWFGTISY
jgi:hypothetical protein